MVFSLLIRFIAVSHRVNVTWSEQGGLGRFAWDKWLRLFALFDGAIPIESLVEVVIDNEAHSHHILVVDLPDHANKLGLKLGKRLEHVAQCLTALTRLRLVDHLVREVDVAFD